MDRDRRVQAMAAAARPGTGTPATHSPSVPVGCSGTLRPLQVTAYLSPVMPCTLTCSRSTEESTYRTVAPAAGSSPKTYHGSMACRNSISIPLRSMLPISGKRNSKCGANQSAFQRDAGLARFFNHVAEVLPHEVRQQEPVVQASCPNAPAVRGRASPRTGPPSDRSSSCWVRLMRACGGISNARNSTSPSRPVAVSGE